MAASVGYAVCGFFRPYWPIPLIFGVLFASGTFMSFQFTALNTIAYAEISKSRMSAATSFYATFEQLTLSFGVCVGSASLQFAMLISGSPIPLQWHFTLAFLIVTAISPLANYWNIKFADEAGMELSVYVPRTDRKTWSGCRPEQAADNLQHRGLAAAAASEPRDA
ncbi:MAG: hypothetical protein ACLQL2_09475 [Methylovirgula sp.]